MRKARIFMRGIEAGVLEERNPHHYLFQYHANYSGPPISLRLPVHSSPYEFDQFPSFFEGLLPEGMMLEAILKRYKLDRDDYFGQLIQVGQDLVGAVTVEELL